MPLPRTDQTGRGIDFYADCFLLEARVDLPTQRSRLVYVIATWGADRILSVPKTRRNSNGNSVYVTQTEERIFSRIEDVRPVRVIFWRWLEDRTARTLPVNPSIESVYAISRRYYNLWFFVGHHVDEDPRFDAETVADD